MRTLLDTGRVEVAYGRHRAGFFGLGLYFTLDLAYDDPPEYSPDSRIDVELGAGPLRFVMRIRLY